MVVTRSCPRTAEADAVRAEAAAEEEAAAEAAAGQPASNPALWSVPVEMELYLVYPIVWLAARRWGWRVALTVTSPSPSIPRC